MGGCPKSSPTLAALCFLPDGNFVSLMVSKFSKKFTDERNVETQNRAEDIQKE
jgi:hypothetical protein